MIVCKVMEITPKLAESWLQYNDGNRHLNKSIAAAYARDMEQGRWALNGETIKISFDSNGCPHVDDGQHRLTGIVMSGVSIKSVVVFDAPDVRYVDNGSNRKFKDSAILGDVDANKAWMRSNVIAAIARFSITYSSGHSRKITNGEVLDFMLNHQESAEYVYHRMNQNSKVKGINKSGVWAAIISAYECGYNFEQLQEFTQIFISGEAFDRLHTPIIRFRNWCIENGSTGGYMKNKEAYKRCQYALKAFETKNAVATTKEAIKEFYPMHTNKK